MIMRLCLAIVSLLIGHVSALSQEKSQEYLIRVDLTRQSDFDRATQIDWEPVYRWGNEFFVVVDATGLADIDRLRLSHTVIDTNPFADGSFYCVESSRDDERSDKLSLPESDVLDHIGKGILCRFDPSLKADALAGGDFLVAVTGEPIPLIYQRTATARSIAGDYSPVFDSIAARISEDSVLAIGHRLESFQTRFRFTDSNIAAAEYIYEKFLSMGYTDVIIDTFPASDRHGNLHDARNVVCIKTGDVARDEHVLVTAHFDSENWGKDPLYFAPGGDDNASGVTGVLETARALAGMPTWRTIIFIAFDCEEWLSQGSERYAYWAWRDHDDIKLVLNMDMIGFEPNGHNLLVDSDESSSGYGALLAEIAREWIGMGAAVDVSGMAGSDHVYFWVYGYQALCVIEGDFNELHYHSNSDSIAYLDVPYWTDVVRAVAMTTYAVSDAAATVDSVEVFDVGDGQSLEVRWEPSAVPEVAGYRVRWGDSSGDYDHAMDVPDASTASVTLTGLAEGVEQFISVTSVAASGRESVVLHEVSMTPQLVPRAVHDLATNVELNRIELSWEAAAELDFDHYAVYRGYDSLLLYPYVPLWQSEEFTDTDVHSGVRYYYRIAAVDQSGLEGDVSNVASAVPATFDRGILVYDLTSGQEGEPDEQDQKQFYRGMLDGYPSEVVQCDDYYLPVDKSIIGQYGTLLWIDDDNQLETWPPEQVAKLEWYVSYGNDLIVAGWQTPGEMQYIPNAWFSQVFGVQSVSRVDAADCLGGSGLGGIPDVVFDTAKLYSVWDGKCRFVWKVDSMSQDLEVILSYNSASGDTSYDGAPIGVWRDNGLNKLALINLPIYFLRPADAANLMTALIGRLGMAPSLSGDLTGDGWIDALDLSTMIDALYAGQPPPAGYKPTDVNGDCTLDALDLAYLIDYIFAGGGNPQEGCYP